MTKKNTFWITLGVCLCFLLLAVNSFTRTLLDKPLEAPINDWSVIEAASAGFDVEILKQLTRDIQSGEIHNIHALLIEHDGKLIYEEYFTGTDEKLGAPLGEITFNSNTLHDIRSVTKSIISAALGVALGEQYPEALQQPLISYFPELKDQLGPGADKVTLQHALTMTAGLRWNEMEVPYSNPKNDEIAMYSTPNPVAMVLSRDAVTPAGSEWYYSGGLSQVVGSIIHKQTGLALDDYIQQTLFDPLGIKDIEWMGPPHWESPSAAAGLRMRARDMAKIGSVFLHQGQWNGQQIVPAAWVKASTEQIVDSTPWGDGFADYGYGFMWFPGKLKADQNLRIIRALGWGGQAIFILPELKLSVTVMAGNYRGEGRGNNRKILQAILAARQ